MSKLYECCANVYDITEKHNSKNKQFKLEDISALTTIFSMGAFEVQTESPNYYIPKYDILLTHTQAQKFMKEHSDERFILLDNYDGQNTHVFLFLDSQPNILTVYCFHITGKGDHLTMFAQFRNEPGKAHWEDIKLLTSTITKATRSRQTYYRQAEEDSNFYFTFPGNTSEIYQGEIINGGYSGETFEIKKLLTDCLRIEGKTRIVRTEGRYGSGYYSYETGQRPEMEDLPVHQRYGLPLSKMITNNPDDHFYRWSWRYGDNWMLNRYETFESELSESEQKRIHARINAKLDAQSNPSNKYKILTADILVISEPIQGHRRPSFHFIRGFRCNDITEIVELSRGEMLMKDMLPEKIYCLTDMNTYALASYDVKTGMIKLITDANKVEIDPESFNKWAEEKSLHPYLLKLLTTNYFDNISLPMIKSLNRLPFGSLLVEQLISTKHGAFALALAQYINQNAYDFNVVCSDLGDIFPGCNADETSLYKILNISRQTAQYLLTEPVLTTFILKYNALHHFGGNLVLTDDIKNKIETYLSLSTASLHKFTLLWGNRQFDFLNYPQQAKQVARMLRKIDNLTGLVPWQMRDIRNKYTEIVRAYCSFLDYATIAPENEKGLWDPERLMIFLEFSLTGTPSNPLDPVEEISSRERAANTALKIYEDKANEKMHEDNEIKFAIRRKQLLKLRSLATLEKEDPDFKDYIVTPPTQIYGISINGSVEKEADDLDHCLFRAYTNRIVEGEYTPMWLRLKNKINESVITIGITKDGRIEQTRGLHDRDATVAEAKAIAAWAKSKEGLVTFQSEGADVKPGGWPTSVPVPSLPKPSADWLQKLQAVKEVN